MQAIRAYYDEGKFVPFKPVKIPKGSHAIVTILDFPLDRSTSEADGAPGESRIEWLKRLHEAIDFSMDEEMPHIPRSKEMRPPINMAD